MATKKKKSADVAGTIAPAEEQTPKTTAPDTFFPQPEERDNKLLADRLWEDNLLTTEVKADRIDELVAGLTDAEYATVFAWAREHFWMICDAADVGDLLPSDRAVRASKITVPGPLTALVAEDVADISSMIDHTLIAREQVVYDEVAEADYEIVDEEPATAEQLPLVTEDAVDASRPLVLEMRTRDEGAQIAGAIKDRAADLMKLAKSAKDLEQHREARHFENLAKSLTLDLLPQIESTQASLPFEESTPFLTVLANSFGHTIYAAFNRHVITTANPRNGESRDEAIERTKHTLRDVEQMLGRLPAFIAPTALEYFLKIAEEAQAAGYAQRTETPEHLVRKAVHAIRTEKELEDAA